MSTEPSHAVRKLTSGRWLLTIGCVIAFLSITEVALYMLVVRHATDVSVSLLEWVQSVVFLVVGFYFGQHVNGGGGDGATER